MITDKFRLTNLTYTPNNLYITHIYAHICTYTHTLPHYPQAAVLHAAKAGEEGEKESLTPIIAVCGSLFASSEARECLFDMDESLFQSWDWVRYQD